MRSFRVNVSQQTRDLEEAIRPTGAFASNPELVRGTTFQIQQTPVNCNPVRGATVGYQLNNHDRM